jgi:ATP-dependent Clp protease ATP-binding subunit ClpC
MDMTDRAWHVVRQAREEAVRLGDEYVGTDHLLLAMLRDGEGAAANVLSEFDVSYQGVYDQIAGTPAA